MRISKFAYSIPALMLIMTSAQATSLKNVVEETVKNNHDIISKSVNNEAFRKYIDEQKGGYYPKLDLTAYLQRKKTKEDFDYNLNKIDTDDTLDGGNVQLDFEQLLYDGNLTPKRVEEAKASYISNKLKNSNDVESILLDSVNAYLNISKFNERIEASEENLKIHEDYLTIATETEAINGEILDKVQTKAKIHNAKSKLFEERNNQNTAKSSFRKNVGISLKSDVCRPNIDLSAIPSTLNSLQKIALQKNYEILEQIENIKEQKAVISQEKSGFLPTLKFKLQGIYDKDLLEDDTATKVYSGKLELKYNIFNGLTNKNRTQREELFLKEAQAKLDVVSKSVIDDVTVAYNTFNTAKQQIVELKQFIEENKQIIDIYNDQFDAGTRNFIDVLNVEADLYNSKVNLINSEYIMYQSYYEILKNTSSLQSTIVNTQDQSCSSSSNNDMDELKELTSTDSETVSDVLNADTSTLVDTSVEETTREVIELTESQSLVSNEYALFLKTFSSKKIAVTELEKISQLIDAPAKIKIEENKNDTYTVSIYNLDGKHSAISMKEKLNGNYPQSYYIKKKK